MKFNKFIRFANTLMFALIIVGLAAPAMSFSPLEAGVAVAALVGASYIVKLSAGSLASSLFYPEGCDADLGSHVCDPCPTKELGRVRGVAFIRNDYAFTDYSDTAQWAAGIESGQIFVIPETNGTYDGGTPTYSTGFGDADQSYDSSTFKLVVKDPNFIGNRAFYNALKKSRNYRVAWRSETILQISDVACTAVGKAPIADDIKSVRTRDVEITFTQSDDPTEVTMPDGVFVCTEVVA